MPIRRIHAGQVYLGKDVLEALGIRDGDLVSIEVSGNEIVLRPVKTVNKDTLELIKMLKETRAHGDRVDYFEEYKYEDIGG